MIPRLLILCALLLAGIAGAEPGVLTPSATAASGGALPTTPNATNAALTITVDGGAEGNLSTALVILLTITALSVAPAFIMMMTCFTRIIIVLGFVRRALGTQTLPPNQVMLGLALFISLFVMAPTMNRMHAEAWVPYQESRITQLEAVDAAKNALRDFMIRQTRKSDLALFLRLSDSPRPKTVTDVPFVALVPAFIISELKTAFQMGFIIFLPFLIIDLVISAILMAMGMMMLPPVVVSLPFKILLFVLVDGWALLVQGLVASYR